MTTNNFELHLYRCKECDVYRIIKLDRLPLTFSIPTTMLGVDEYVLFNTNKTKTVGFYLLKK